MDSKRFQELLRSHADLTKRIKERLGELGGLTAIPEPRAEDLSELRRHYEARQASLLDEREQVLREYDERLARVEETLAGLTGRPRRRVTDRPGEPGGGPEELEPEPGPEADAVPDEPVERPKTRPKRSAPRRPDAPRPKRKG